MSVSKENSSTAEVLESISRSVRVKPENLRLAEVRHLQHSEFYSMLDILKIGLKILFHFLQVGKNRFHRMFLPSHSLDTVSSSDMLFCFEVLSKELAKERVVLLRVQQVIKKKIKACLHIFLLIIFYMLVYANIEKTSFAFCLPFRNSRYPISLSLSVLPAWSLQDLRKKSWSDALAAIVWATAISEFSCCCRVVTLYQPCTVFSDVVFY